MSFLYILREITLHRASVSILYEIGSPLEVRVIDEKELLFFISFLIKAVLDPNCLYKKFKIGRPFAVSLGLLDFVYLFFDFGDNKF